LGIAAAIPATTETPARGQTEIDAARESLKKKQR
jgi:hypothetical protein